MTLQQTAEQQKSTANKKNPNQEWGDLWGPFQLKPLYDNICIIHHQDIKQIWQNKNPWIQDLSQAELHNMIQDLMKSLLSLQVNILKYSYKSCTWASYVELWTSSLSLAILNPWKNQYK